MVRAPNNQKTKNYNDKEVHYVPTIRVEETKIIPNVQDVKKQELSYSVGGSTYS